jgi:hypothetical protein
MCAGALFLERERETLHLFQKPRADHLMPDFEEGQQYKDIQTMSDQSSNIMQVILPLELNLRTGMCSKQRRILMTDHL